MIETLTHAEVYLLLIIVVGLVFRWPLWFMRALLVIWLVLGVVMLAAVAA